MYSKQRANTIASLICQKDSEGRLFQWGNLSFRQMSAVSDIWLMLYYQCIWNFHRYIINLYAHTPLKCSVLVPRAFADINNLMASINESLILHKILTKCREAYERSLYQVSNSITLILHIPPNAMKSPLPIIKPKSILASVLIAAYHENVVECLINWRLRIWRSMSVIFSDGPFSEKQQ